MVFFNMLGKDYVKSYKNGKLVIKDEEMAQNTFFYQDEDGVLKPTTDTSKENLFTKELVKEGDSDVYRIGKPNGRKGKITYDMIKDTEENPLIIVLCNKISLFSGVEAELRFITLEDAILVCLVSGACAFNDVVLQRCNTMNVDGRSTIDYSVEKFNSFAKDLYVDYETGYHYADDILCSLLIEHTADGVNAKGTMRNKVFLSKDGLERAKKIKEDKKGKADAIKKKLYEEEESKRQAIIKKEKDEIEAKRKAEVEAEMESASIGAMNFLKALESLRG